jgi:hypothetical protein
MRLLIAAIGISLARNKIELTPKNLKRAFAAIHFLLGRSRFMQGSEQKSANFCTLPKPCISCEDIYFPNCHILQNKTQIVKYLRGYN